MSDPAADPAPQAQTDRRPDSRVVRWAGYLAAYGASSGIVQILGAVSTFIYVRLLDTDQYAVLALCLTTMAFVSLVSDLGLTGSLVWFHRRALQEGGGFDRHVAAVRQMRLWLFPLAAGGGAIILALLFSRRGLLGLDSALALIALLLVSAVQLDLSLRQTVMRIRGAANPTYLADVLSAAVRALTASGLMLAAIHLSAPAMAGIAIGAIAANLFLRRIEGPWPATAVSPALRRDVLAYVLPTTPAVLLFAMNDLIIYGIVLMTTGATVVANVFALGRISAFLSALGGMFTVVVLPRLANMAHGDTMLRRGFLIVGITLAVLLPLGICIRHFPDIALLLVGDRYAHLQDELFLSFLIASTNLVAGNVTQINRAMGWVRAEPLKAVLVLGWLLALFLLEPVRETGDVLSHWLWVSLAGLGVTSLITLVGLLAPDWVRARRRDGDEAATGQA